MTLTPGDGACPIVDRCVWQNKGPGRDWYEAKGCPIGLKIHRHDSKYDSNEVEWKLYLSNEVLRANAPKMYGHFVVFSEEHDFMTPVALSVLVQERVGESLGQILDRLCLENSFDYDTKVEVLSLWEKTLVLTDNLASSGTGWWNDFHTGNVNISLCGGRMLWVDPEAASTDKGHVDNMRAAVKFLKKSIQLPRQWQSFHSDLMTDLMAFLSYATAATIGPGWWKDSLRRALGASGVPVNISTSESAAAASRGKMVPMTPPDPPPLCIDPRGAMVPRTPPDPPEPNRLGYPPLRSVLKRCFQEAATAQSSSSSSSTQQVRFQCPSPPVEVRSYKKIMKDHLQFDGVTVCDGRYCRHSFLAGAGEGLFPWDENGELLGNLNRYEIFCDECQRDMEKKLGLFLNTYAT